MSDTPTTPPPAETARETPDWAARLNNALARLDRATARLDAIEAANPGEQVEKALHDAVCRERDDLKRDLAALKEKHEGFLKRSEEATARLDATIAKAEEALQDTLEDAPQDDQKSIRASGESS